MFVDASYQDSSHYVISRISFGSREEEQGAEAKIRAALNIAKKIGLIEGFSFESVPPSNTKRSFDTSPLFAGHCRITWPSTSQLDIPENQCIGDALLLSLLSEQGVQLEPSHGMLSGTMGRRISSYIQNGNLSRLALEADIITQVPSIG